MIEYRNERILDARGTQFQSASRVKLVSRWPQLIPRIDLPTNRCVRCVRVTGGRLDPGGSARWFRGASWQHQHRLGSPSDPVVLARGHQGAVLHNQPAIGRGGEVGRWLLRLPVDQGPVAVHLREDLDPVRLREERAQRREPLRRSLPTTIPADHVPAALPDLLEGFVPLRL